MTSNDQERLSRLLRASFVPLGDPGPPHGLWPMVVGRIHERPRLSRLDTALLGALLAYSLFVPRSVLWLMSSL
jgi:hypothetical protein